MSRNCCHCLLRPKKNPLTQPRMLLQTLSSMFFFGCFRARARSIMKSSDACTLRIYGDLGGFKDLPGKTPPI